MTPNTGETVSDNGAAIEASEQAACPFCGSADTFNERADFSSSYVFCNNCGAKGPSSCDETDADAEASDNGAADPGELAARRLWNTRATPRPSLTDTDTGVVERHSWTGDPHGLANELRRVANCFKPGFRMPQLLRDAADEIDCLTEIATLSPDRLQAERMRALEQALEPFVRHGRAIGALGGNNGPFWIMTHEGHRDVPAADFRRAAAPSPIPHEQERGL